MEASQSFYTISSSSSGSSSMGSFHNGPLTPPTSTTHDTSRSSYHISDISSFADSLQDAANQAFPNRNRSRYHTVNICLIRWEEDELVVKPELDRLHDVFSTLYGFNTEIWLIPSRASQIQLTSMTCNFLQRFDDEGNLFIVYYGGHGTINAARQSQWWCSSRPGSPVVDWSAIQTLFGSARSDVLVLLDCCAAASSAGSSGTGVMEAIAACGFETRAPPPGQYSFTNTLIEVLEEWVHKPSFSAAMLHTEVLFVLKQKRPERGRDGRRLEWCATPVHLVYTGNPKAAGIELCSLKSEQGVKKTLPSPTTGERGLTSYVDAMEIDGGESLSACQPNGDYQVPHVLISIALEGEQGTLDAIACRRWLADFPALVKYATVEGVYKGFSTLMTLSIPVMVWDMLPEHPACSFIGYVISPNKYIPTQETADMVVSQVPQKQKPRRYLKDPSISSCDSSYGSEYSPSRGMSRARTDVDFESDENFEEDIIISDDDASDASSSWQGSLVCSSPSLQPATENRHEEPMFTRQDIKQDAIHAQSLIAHLLNQSSPPEKSQPIDIPDEPETTADGKKRRNVSPDACILSPRSVRRNMMAEELTATLREHLLWERQTRRRLVALRDEMEGKGDDFDLIERKVEKLDMARSL